MTAPHASRSGSFPMARAIVACATILFASPITGSRLAAQSPTPTPAGGAPAPTKRNIAGPGDFALREKIVHLVGRDPDLAKERFNIILVNGGAGVSREITSWGVKKPGLPLTATGPRPLTGTAAITDQARTRSPPR